MKILGISILMLGLLVGIALGMDILLRFDVDTSLKHVFNPFLVMETPEFFIFLVFLFALVAPPIRSFFRKKKQQTTKDKKQHQP
jgi:hypothetical protein